MKKVIRDNKVAVLISPGYGAGWYSWNSDHKELLFHPKIVEMVENGRQNEIDEDWIKDNLNLDNIYCGGNHKLKIVWLTVGTQFYIKEYDGSENLEEVKYLDTITA